MDPSPSNSSVVRQGGSDEHGEDRRLARQRTVAHHGASFSVAHVVPGKLAPAED